MSCSIAVAHSSSRSLGSPRCRPAAASASHSSSASVATCSTCAKSASYWAARLRTVALRTSSTSGGSPSSVSKKTPSRRPASVASIIPKPPTSITVSTTSAPARIRSARAYLMPGTSPRSSGGRSARRLDQVAERVAGDRGSPGCRRTAARRRAARRRRGCGPCRRSRSAGRPRPATRRARSPPRRGRAAPSICLRLALPPSGMKRSVIRTAPSGQERPSIAARSSTRVSCIEPPPRSSTTPWESVVVLTAAR